MKLNIPFVSVIVPTYQRNELLCGTISGLLSQDYPRLEILVIDQSPGHDQSTTQFLASVADRVRLVHLNEPNLPAARNVGIKHSGGDLVVFFDDDMIIPPDTVARLVRNYADPAVWGVAGFIVGTHQDEEFKIQSYSRYVKRADELRRGKLIKVGDFIGGFMSFRKALFRQVGGFDEWIGTQPVACGEDLEFTRRTSLAGFGLYLDTNLTIQHVSYTAGGCGRRTAPASVIEHNLLKMRLYCYLKNRRFPGWLGLVHAYWLGYRGDILNRSLLALSPVALLRKHRTFAQALSAARRALRQNTSRSTNNLVASQGSEC